MLDLSSKTVGVLAGMGPAAGVNFQRLLVAELNRAGVVEDSKFPRMIVLSVPLREWDNHGALNKTVVAQQVRQGINWLESFGASIIAVPCNSVHEFIESRLVVNIIDATLERCADANTVGVLCSRQARDSKLYERNNQQQYVYVHDQAAIDRIIAQVLCGYRPDVFDLIGELFAASADVVVLGCTELSLCEHLGFIRVIDSSHALAEEVCSRLVASVSGSVELELLQRGVS